MQNAAILEGAIRRRFPEHAERMIRVYRFIRDRPDRKRREIMTWTGFAKIDRVTEFVEFENTLLRLRSVCVSCGLTLVEAEDRYAFRGEVAA